MTSFLHPRPVFPPPPSPPSPHGTGEDWGLGRAPQGVQRSSKRAPRVARPSVAPPWGCKNPTYLKWPPKWVHGPTPSPAV
uniref:Uncharacterized protein n=1 Tax=Knipowitschia caucasica TaxID=637954 RepID=A0AAV2LZS4_KNICA